MRMPRFRVRTLMLAVAAVSAGLALMFRPGPPRAVKATSHDPKVAVRQEKKLDGVLWGLSYDEACEWAKAEGRPILVYFSGIHDANGRLMEAGVFPRDEIMPLLSRFVTVRLDVDTVPIGSLISADRDSLAGQNIVLQQKLAADSTVPYFLVLSERGKVLGSLIGARGPKKFGAFLDGALESYRAQAGRRTR